MKIKGFLFAVVSALFFGCAGLFVKRGYSDSFDPVDLLMLQYILASILLLMLCLVKYRQKLKLSRLMLKRLLILGIFGNTFMTVFYYESFRYLDMAMATMLLFTSPAMVSISSFVFFKTRISKGKVVSILGTFIGCLFVLDVFSNKIHISLIGVTFALLSAAFYSFMNLYSEQIVEDVPGLVITFYTTLFSLVVLLLFHFSFLTKLSTSSITMDSIINASMLAFFCEIIPLTLLYEAIKLIGPVSTSIISTLELPASAIIAYLFLHEDLSISQIVGIILVIWCVTKLKNEPQKTV